MCCVPLMQPLPEKWARKHSNWRSSNNKKYHAPKSLSIPPSVPYLQTINTEQYPINFTMHRQSNILQFLLWGGKTGAEQLVALNMVIEKKCVKDLREHNVRVKGIQYPTEHCMQFIRVLFMKCFLCGPIIPCFPLFFDYKIHCLCVCVCGVAGWHQSFSVQEWCCPYSAYLFIYSWN